VRTVPHVLRVKSLYRKSLKSTADWYWQRDEYREKAVRIREMFEENRGVSNPQEIENLCTYTEILLSGIAHPQPVIPPSGYGGVTWERNLPFPKHMLNRFMPYDDSS
ncbi:hypothetical protein HK405_009589, partial [Cladochytrium tenue]